MELLVYSSRRQKHKWWAKQFKVRNLHAKKNLTLLCHWKTGTCFSLRVKTFVNMNTSLCESYRDAPLQLHHIAPIDFHSIVNLPDSHRWPALEDLKPCKEPIPVIDLKSIHVVNMLGNACRKWGIFQLIGHDVSLGLLEDVEFHAMRLFDLPSRIKFKALRSPDGGTGYGIARMSKFFDKFMWHEGFTIMGSSLTKDAQILWPADYAEFCCVMDRYQKKMELLSQQITQLILDSLGLLGKDFLQWSSPSTASTGCTALQLNYYPTCPDPAHSIGLAPHTDTFLLTILHQDRSASGLQIYKDCIGWVPVPPVVKGALLVNLGDLMHILSNGLYPSVMHRAALPMNSHRLSVAYFYGPSVDSEVSPVRMHSSVARETQQFRSVLVKDYVKMKEKYFNDTLSRLANC